jgi:hypothetical protein
VIDVAVNLWNDCRRTSRRWAFQRATLWLVVRNDFMM